MDVTIAICTRNRADLLAQALDSIGRLRIPDRLSWELIVVNNNSTDNTDNVIAAYVNRGALPIRREFEAVLGNANARNRATSVAQGNYLIWIDDDVVVHEGWLCAYVDAFRRWPDATFFGGKVIPQLEEPVPQWIRETWDSVPIVRTVFAFRDYGDKPIPLSLNPRRVPVGANCAILAAVQKEYGYHRNLGVRGPKRGISAADSFLFERLLHDGHSGYWVPEAILAHHIPQSRQTVSALKAHCLALGRGEAFRSREAEGVRVAGVPRWLLRRLIGSWFKYWLYRLTSTQKVWLGYYVAYLQNLGGLDLWLRHRFHRREQFACPLCSQ